MLIASITVAAVLAFDSAPVTDERLATLHAGTDTVSNEMRLNGAVTGNTTSNVVSGANTISNGAFSNASGLPVAIQNSGSNVLIQNATIINIQMQ
ncbi:hypothetical protein SAMN05216319_0594 [Duganella sp. CF402]|uniref:hypothetical protein n=1 Tax=unclassified Duganella TaxID=2636909 RepID=UPI0008C73844|nr:MULTISPECIES: hypothetical protein [unclassified Duganella]RZT10938.1 hypothetical protein EV582_3031 [Duganella sp. BK701]SEK89125.1 hypothetical protein SAMN05216319_0594 [Duganella sp. CF402]